MLYYILLVAVLNLGLGFVIAVRLGRRYRDLVAMTDETSMESMESIDTKTEMSTEGLESPSEAEGSDTTDPVQVTQTTDQDTLVSMDDLLEDLKADLKDDPDSTFNESAESSSQCEQQLDAVLDVCGTDPLTNLPSRTGLSETLEQWWQEDPDHGRTLCSAMLEVDGLGTEPREEEMDVENQIIKSIAEILVGGIGPDAILARYSTRCFFALFPDTDLETSEKRVQNLSETVQSTPFGTGSESFELLIRSAVLSVEPREKASELFTRSEKVIALAMGEDQSTLGGEKEHSSLTDSSDVA